MKLKMSMLALSLCVATISAASDDLKLWAKMMGITAAAGGTITVAHWGLKQAFPAYATFFCAKQPKYIDLTDEDKNKITLSALRQMSAVYVSQEKFAAAVNKFDQAKETQDAITSEVKELRCEMEALKKSFSAQKDDGLYTALEARVTILETASKEQGGQLTKLEILMQPRTNSPYRGGRKLTDSPPKSSKSLGD